MMPGNLELWKMIIHAFGGSRRLGTRFAQPAVPDARWEISAWYACHIHEAPFYVGFPQSVQ